jgi:hypothetical protein
LPSLVVLAGCQALALMSTYAKQVRDNPPEDGFDAGANLGIFHLSDDERLKMAAIVFMRFGVAKPTSSQWQAAYERLFRPVSSSTTN